MAFIYSSIYDMDDDSQLNQISMRWTVIERAMSEHHIPIDRTWTVFTCFIDTRRGCSFKAEMAFIYSSIYDMDDDSQLNQISMRQTVIERAMSEHHIPIDRTF